MFPTLPLTEINNHSSFNVARMLTSFIQSTLVIPYKAEACVTQNDTIRLLI